MNLSPPSNQVIQYHQSLILSLYIPANIHNKEINIDFFKAIVKNNSFIKKFYTIPFLEIMNEISKTKEIEDLIIKVNNPYWIIKELMKENQYILDGLGS